MKILITGAAGFLGSHLCEALLKEGHYVIALDNLQTGQKSNIDEFMTNENFEFHNIDIQQPFHFEVDQIYNLACPASPSFYQMDPVDTLKTCILGTINCLDLAKKLGIKILHASTSEVYGDPKVHPQCENYWGNVNPTGPRACYDEGKRAAETLCFDYHRQYNTNIRVIRIFNTYGPKMHPQDGRVISNFINQALENKPITIYGKGDQTRSFCYVDDLINGITLMMNQDQDIGPVNLGNPTEFTILQLAQKVIQMTNSSSPIEFHELPPDDPIQRKPNIQKAQEILSWSPNTHLDQGLTQTINYYKELNACPTPINS